MSKPFSEHAAVSRICADSQPPQVATISTPCHSARVAGFIDAYRNHGYRLARLDPLELAALPDLPELSPQSHGLAPAQAWLFDQAAFSSALTVEQLERQLKRVYCGAIGLDCSGMRSGARRSWLFARMESDVLSADATPAQRGAVLRRLLAAEMWERHVAARFEHAKRFSLEGCESLVPLLDELIERAGQHGLRQMFVGMPHRGRLNALVNVLDFPVDEMLARLDHDSDLAAVQKDLPYHLGGTALKRTVHGDVTVCLAHNPSHLQSVYPVVSGSARAYNDEHPGYPAVPVVVHGDAAFAGQGIVMETLNMTQKSGYTLGGTIHVIVNNQIGFTTPNRMDVRANVYCTDIARMIDAPVIHVNADHPDDVLRAARIAFDYRMEHGADVVIDLIGYRRLGHSEHDEPALTQPFLHAAIACHPSVTERYHAAIGAQEPLDTLREEALQSLQTRRPASLLPGPGGLSSKAAMRPRAQTLSLARLQSLTAATTHVPPGVVLHDLVRKLTGKWRAAVASEHNRVDWCFAENIAYASLVADGHGIRLSGMDVGRGTFMHRHAVWHAQDCLSGANDVYIPLKHVAPQQGSFDIVNSPLTEEAVLGFEYGYSVHTNTRLTIWEAQFGDFVNGAQVIVDQYIAAGEYKWGYQSALTVLLPHGHEGVGPEHSNAYLGRFLQLCADRNLRVAVPSTSAQWFHLLREQAAAPHPKPLIVMSPKVLLHSNERSHSPLAELIGRAFLPVLADSSVTAPEAVNRVVLCSGKFFYELEAARDERADIGTALLRVEQLYPFPTDELADALAGFANLAEVIWAQEEDRNHGAWRFVRDDLEGVVPPGCRLSHVARSATASGAHASVTAHQQEQRRLVEAALARAPENERRSERSLALAV